MFQEIAQIQSAIQTIQAQIAALSPAAPKAASFANALSQAQNATSPASSTGVEVPPASLGPLPPLPISPSSPGVAPISSYSIDNYDGLIQAYAAKNGVPPALVRAVIQTESGGNPNAISSAGAKGLMQLMPENLTAAGVTDPFDPAQNIAAGTQQLASLLLQYHGDLNLALAAYNAGSGNVRKYGGVPPFLETQNYLRKVIATMQKNP